MQPEALNCPNCGGAVASDRSSCEFCRSRLKTVACTRCLGLMFLGSKFCSHCGYAANRAEPIESDDSRDCPRCKTSLQQLKIDAIVIAECGRCGGIWSDIDTFDRLCFNEEQQASVLGAIDGYVRPSLSQEKVSYVPCPVCKELMNRINFARSSGVVIDTCKRHGVWFDASELPKIFEFIGKGGLSRQREKEKRALEEERARLRDERRRLGSLDR